MLLREARTLLGIDTAISSRDLRSKYRNLVKQLHPDGGAGDSSRLNQVLEAYRIVQRQLEAESLRRERIRRKPAADPGPSHPAASGVRERYNRYDSARQASTARDESTTGRSRVPSIKDDPRLLFTYGRWATGSQDPAVRRLAVRRIAQSGLTAAQVFLKQAVFDTDRGVAIEAAAGLTRINGSRTEQTILSLFDDLTVAQRLAILEEAAGNISRWFRLLAYAEADHYLEVRRRAAAILRSAGER